MSDTSYYRSLTRSMFLKVALVSLTPMLIIIFVAAWLFHTSYTEKVVSHLEELVERHAQSIDSFLYSRTAEMRMLAAAAPLEALRDQENLERLLLIMQEQYDGVFVDLGLVAEDGVQAAYAGPFQLGRARYADAAWFRTVMERGIYVSDVFLGLRGLPHFIVGVRRVDDQGRAWVLRSTIDFVAFTDLVRSIRLGQTGHAYIVNQQGELQTGESETLAEEIPTVLKLAARTGAGARAENGRDVRVFTAEILSGGSEAIYVTAPIKGGDWTLVFRQEERDAFADLYRARNVDLAVMAAGTLAIIVMAWLVSRQTVERIEASDREKELVNEQFIEAGKLASVGELAAGIAHEINNPVAIMVEEAGWIDDLLTDGEQLSADNRAEIVRALAQIRTQGSRCKDITHKLLSFARRTDPSIAEVSLNELVDEILAISEQRARLANIRIERRFLPVPTIVASAAEMQQVLLNLINNAVDAMDKGGVLKVATWLEDRQVVLQVSDTGHGIPQANLQRIFDPFFTTKPVGRGTGLGLSIVYGIVQKMGGDIRVSSTVGVGSTFSVFIPVKDTQKAAAEVETPGRMVRNKEAKA